MKSKGQGARRRDCRFDFAQRLISLLVCRDFQVRVDLAWSLSLSKGIKKATSPFHAALFAC